MWRKKAEENLPRGLVQPLAVGEQERLAQVAGLQPYFTPGHAPGHVVYFHEQDGVLLAGDLFSSKKGRLHRPMFTPDMGEALRSALVVKELKPQRVEVCHGDPVFDAAGHLEAYIAQTAAKYAVTGDVLV